MYVDPEVLPETGQSNAFIEQRSLSATSDLTLERRWNAKQTTNTTLTYSRRTYLDELGYDSSGRSASVSHQWAATRTFSVDGSYLFADTAYSDSGSSTGEQPLTNHGFELGATYARRVSPTRQLRLEWGGGATYVQTLSTIDRSPQDYWMPSGHGTLRVDLGRSWAVAADYRRAISVLQGVTLESFATDAMRISADGAMGRRVQASVAVAYSNGQSSAADSPSRFSSYGSLAQIRYGLARCCALSVDYDYYFYHLDDVTGLPEAVPARYDRHAVRFGFSFNLPLYGSYSGGSERTQPRGRR